MKNVKKNLIATVLVACGAIMASQSAFAGTPTFVANDLYLGFQNKAGSGSADYIINLGPASGIVSGSSVVDLSSHFSMTDFNSVLGGSSSMYAGVVGGKQNSISPDVYVTQLRRSPGTPSVAGSTAPKTLTSGDENSAIAPLGNLNAPAADSSILDTTLSWQNYVEPTTTASTFVGASGINPDSAVGTSSVLYEDLYYAHSGSAFAYQGYFTVDLTGATPSVTFTPKNAPASLTSPGIQSISKAGNSVTVISSNAVPGFSYQLQYTVSLNPANWINVGSAQVAGATTVTNMDATATDSQRFYRVMAQ